MSGPYVNIDSLAIEYVTFSVIVDFVFTSHSARLKQKKKKRKRKSDHYLCGWPSRACTSNAHKIIPLTHTILTILNHLLRMLSFCSVFQYFPADYLMAQVNVAFAKAYRCKFWNESTISSVSCVVLCYSLILSHKSHYAH